MTLADQHEPWPNSVPRPAYCASIVTKSVAHCVIVFHSVDSAPEIDQPRPAGLQTTSCRACPHRTSSTVIFHFHDPRAARSAISHCGCLWIHQPSFQFHLPISPFSVRVDASSRPLGTGMVGHVQNQRSALHNFGMCDPESVQGRAIQGCRFDIDRLG